jgi:cytochrome P450
MADPFPGPLAPANRDNPYPCYRWLQQEHPVYHDAEGGYWALSRYADVVAAARNYPLFSSAGGIGPGFQRGVVLLAIDPPQHTRLRKLLTRSFQPAVIEALAPRIAAICHELIDASAVARGTFDLMEDFALPLPMIAIAQLLGLDPARRSEYRDWSNALVGSLSRPDSVEARHAYMRMRPAFLSCVAAAVRDREYEPRQDLISLMVQVREDGDQLTAPEIAFSCELFLAAGNETTSSVMGNAALLLATYPDEARRVVQQPDLIPSLIEEVIRFDGPVQATFRSTTAPVSIHGTEIPSGARVALLWAAANRDPAVFVEPDRFLASRSPNPHVGFGQGIHHCIGAPLARLEARVAARVLIERFSRLEPDLAQATRDYSTPLFRRLKTLPMSFTLN